MRGRLVLADGGIDGCFVVADWTARTTIIIKNNRFVDPKNPYKVNISKLYLKCDGEGENRVFEEKLEKFIISKLKRYKSADFSVPKIVKKQK